MRIRGGSGAWRRVLNRSRVVERDRAGRPARIIGTLTDLGEKKKP